MSNLIINRKSPFTLFEDFDDVFGAIANNFSSINKPLVYQRRSTMNTIPLANVFENDSGYEINLAVPGLSRDDISINVNNNILTVSSENEKNQKTEKRMPNREFNYSNFNRSWTLPKETVAESISANYNAGILNITIPTQNKKKQSIKINVD